MTQPRYPSPPRLVAAALLTVVCGCEPGYVEYFGGGSVTVTFEKLADVGIEGSFTVAGLATGQLPVAWGEVSRGECGAASGVSHVERQPGWALVACADDVQDVVVTAPCGQEIQGIDITTLVPPGLPGEVQTSMIATVRTPEDYAWEKREYAEFPPDGTPLAVEPIGATGSLVTMLNYYDYSPAYPPLEPDPTCGSTVMDSTRMTVDWDFDPTPIEVDRHVEWADDAEHWIVGWPMGVAD